MYLKDLVDIVMGQSPDSKFYNYDKIGLPFYQGKTDFGRLNPTPKMWCSKSKKEAKPNDILISVRAPVGDLNINIEQSCIGRGLAAITCKSDVDMMYIYYHLKYLKPQLKHISTGSTFESINRSQLENLNINYKSYAEQIKISNILQVVQRQIDIKENLLRLYDLLIKSRFVELFGDPVLNEKGWNLTSLESVCQSIYGGGTPSKKIKEYYMGTIPWVTSKDMKSDIIVDSIEHITQVAIDNSSTKIIPPESVLIVIRSGILKHTLPVCINKSRVTINQDLKALVLDERCKAIYLQYLLKALEKDILSGVRAVTADNIEFNSLKKRKIPIPPINKQIKFSQMVNQINKLKSDVQKSIDETQLLMDSLMQEYFV